MKETTREILEICNIFSASTLQLITCMHSHDHLDSIELLTAPDTLSADCAPHLDNKVGGRCMLSITDNRGL